MFSHFCGGGATNLLMSPTLEANERRSINSSYEEAVLRALGYKINIGDCNVAGVDDIGPACTNNVFSGDLCLSDNDPSNDQVDITFSVEDLIGNDGEGVDGIAFLELNVGSGQLTNNGDGTYTFSSALPGISVLRYIPTSSSCNKAGNVTRVTISIDVCEGECAFVENGGLTTIDDGFNRNPCNLICNPEFSYMFNNPNTNNDEKLPIGCGGLPGAQAPGVEKATESPDVYFNSFIPYVDLVNGARKHVAYMQIDFDNGEVVVEESIHIPVTIEPESNYLISGFHSCFGNTAEMEMHFASINDLISDQFCPFEKTLVSDVEAYPSGYKEVFKSDYENIANNPNDINWTKFATCFEFNGEFEGTSLWIYPQFVPGSSTTQEGGVISFLDQLELIEDNFDAGQPISISCNQTITIGGDEFCMLSDMAVEYSWYEASDVTFSNPLLSYTLEREYDGTLLIDGQPGSTIPTVQVSPTVNTSYILRRIYIPDPNTEYPTPDFVFCKDTDDLHVEVIGSYDPGFVIYACDYDIIATAVETDQSLDYNWTISDGTTLTGQSISHTVSGDGSYSITLSVGIEGVCQSTSFFPSITLPANCTSFCCPVGATSISDTYVSFGGLSSNIDYCLSGTLIVDDDFVYSGSMSIEPNAKIIVKSGNTLELTGAKLDGCTALWEGISVEGGARLIMSNSEIRDAKTAIFAMRHSYLDITKSNFLQNHIGIQLQPRVEVAPFFDNLFDGSTPLLPALGNDPEIGQSAYSGIISETEKLFIGVEGEGVNEFSFLRNGILSSSQILSVVNSNFSDIRFDSSEPYSIMGYGIFDRHNLYCGSNTSNVTFDDCDFGIYSYGSPGDEIRVTNNTMSNVSTGVSVNKFRYGNIYLIQNEIRATHTGIALLDNNQLNQLAVNSNLIHLTSTGIFGIEVEELGIGQQNAKIIGNEVNLSGISNGIFIRGAQGYELWNNHVKFINGDPGLGIALRAAHHTLLNDNLVEGTSSNTDAIGIDVYSSASVMFDCNTIRNMGVGVSFKGACAGIFEPTLLSTTNFVAPIVTGLRYRDNLDVDQQIHRGNKWDTNNGLFGFAAMNEVSEPDFQISLTSQLFEVHQTALPFYPSSIAFPNATGIVGTDWFQPALGIPAQCAGFINDQLGTVKAEMVARGDGYASQYGTTLLWEARRKLFNTIYSTPDSTYSTPVDSFYNASYTGLIKAFQDYEDSRLDFLQYERERFSGIVGKLNGFRDSVLLFNQSLAKGDTLVTAIRGAYLASIDNLLSDLAREESIYNYRAMNHFSSLEGAIHELHTSTSYETALKQIWRGHARLQQTGRDSFPTNWLSTLENLAESCPLEGGNAIFLARSLYKILEGGHITGGCLGNNAFAIPDPGTGVIANTISIKAFPNPAKSSLTIEFEIPEQGLLRLFDVNGKLVRSESLLRGQGQRFWDISALPSGVLWLQIQSQRKSEIIKVVVLK